MYLLEVAEGRARDQFPLSLRVLPELTLLGELVKHGGSLLVLLGLLLLSLKLALKHYLLPHQLIHSFLLLLLFFLVITQLGVRASTLGAHLEPKDKHLNKRSQTYIWTPLPFYVLTC